jgi:hypothetical protein
MKYETSELRGVHLDAAVAKALGFDWRMTDADLGIMHIRAATRPPRADESVFHPSAEWFDAGPIIESEGIAIARYEYESPEVTHWRADYVDGGNYFASVEFVHRGATPLIAAMRAYVFSKFGHEVDLP